ncbi:hypothetical protein HG263_05795 [Pseudoalteromonas sp. JBTF-M23]|uniref:Cytochrome c family protein n=1 Tax=Pseudoalteromonas caenipelagi TaxID=2726988 RepID=A0A849VB97_9GAMM|nr:hypothetical protein [Pseudoalteromonas caenipelagi]NOU50050.1 hypothetical protein [Pseudoalteromonas caenipelagi]
MLPSKFKTQALSLVIASTALCLLAPAAHAYSNEVCNLEPSWFASPVPNPNEGPNSPFAFKDGKDNSSNCDFHQWSWNKFLYLTQSAKAPGGLFMFGEGFWQVDNALKPYFEPWNDLLNPTGLKPTKHLILEDFNQAGRGDPIIYSKYGGKSVYFSIHVNDTFMKSAMAHPTADPKAEFAVGSVEMKVAWIDVEDLQQVYRGVDLSKQFYIRKAVYKTDNKYSDPTDVAMIGMHVVGVVEDHPEFIWATFEHKLTAPDYYKSGMEFQKSEEYLQQDKVVSTSDNYLLYKGGTEVQNAHLSYPATEKHTNSFRLYQYGVPNGYPYTNSADPSLGAPQSQQDRDVENYKNIARLNGEVTTKLAQSNPVWSNYFYAGSVWLSTLGYNFDNGISGDIVGKDRNDKLRGSLAVANMTMETYTQTFSSTTGTNPQIKPENCFACHGTSEDQSTMQVSHIYNNYLQWVKTGQK